MNAESKVSKKNVGMSLRDFQATLGIQVSSRQFRRYLKSGLIPSKWVKKNANGHFTIHPPANTKWGALRERIEQWRQLRFQRGWSSRPRRLILRNGAWCDKPRSRAIVTIEELSQKSELWIRRMWPDIQKMNREELLQIGALLEHSARLSWWIARKCGVSERIEKGRLNHYGLEG